jgi:hypothetical protein
MKKNLFITIIALAALAMPMFSSCSSDDDNTTLKASDIENPSPLDDAVKALYKNTWYWIGFAVDGEYTQVGNGVGEPAFSVSFSEGRVDGHVPAAGFVGHEVKISGNKINMGPLVRNYGLVESPIWRIYNDMILEISWFEIREDSLLKLAKTEDTYLLYSATRDTISSWWKTQYE